MSIKLPPPYEYYKALGGEVRYAIVVALAERGELRPRDLQRVLPISSGLWNYIQQLQDVGLLRARRLEHARTYYSLDTKVLRAMARRLSQLADMADESREAISAHLDALESARTGELDDELLELAPVEEPKEA